MRRGGANDLVGTEPERSWTGRRCPAGHGGGEGPVMSAPNEPVAGYRPCLIVAHADAAYTAEVCRAFRRLGWDVYAVGTGPEARRLARMLEADLTILDVSLLEETGW